MTTTFDIAKESIELFLEYRDKHGYSESVAMAKAISDICEGVDENPYLLSDEELSRAEAKSISG